MLAIRMQRTGRKGHAMFRVVVQDSRRTPTSGKVVATLGSYDPHQKVMILDKEKAEFYLKNGAQPSDRSARLLKKEGVKLPKWVELTADKERTVRNADKRRSTRPPEPVEEAKEEAAAAETATEETVAEATKETQPEEQADAVPEEKTETAEEEQPAAEAVEAEAPAEQQSAEDQEA